MTSEKILLRALEGASVSRPPYWFMRQAGRFLPEYRTIRARTKGILDLCFTPDLAAEVTLQPVERFDTDAAILFADILVVPHALGQPVAFRDGEGPVLDPIRDAGGLATLRRDHAMENLQPILATVQRLKSMLDPAKALIGFAGAPWTVATYMVEGGSSRDYANIKSWAYADPAGFGELIGLLEAVTSDYLVAQIDAGADVVQIFDTWAGALPAPALRRWVIEPTARIVAAVKEKHPKVPIIGFPRAIGAAMGEFIARSGVDAVSLDSGVDPAWAAAELQPNCAIQGNLDPGLLLVGGAAMREAAGEIVEALGGGPFVFNLGHGIWPATPPEHLTELCALLQGWRYV